MGLFKPATRTKSRLRMAIAGPSGSGKSFTAMRMATAVAGAGGRICVVASEPGAMEKYADLSPDGIPWKFDVCTLDDYSPTKYREAIIAAGREGYTVCIIDSMSHEWEGAGGALELVDQKAAKGRGNKFTEGWGEVTPMHRSLFEAIVRSPCHIIATVRTKTDYAMETDERGKTKPVKVGTKPVQREGIEYEFDVFCRMDLTHTLIVEKTRCPAIDGISVVKPSAATFDPLVRWLNEGADVPEGYYTASEEDLKRSQEAREKAQREANQAAAKLKAAEAAAAPKKSMKQVMQEAAQKKVAEPPFDADKPKITASGIALADGPIANANPGPSPNGPIPANHDQLGSVSKELRERIKAKFDLLNVPPEKRAAALAKRGANALHSLSYDAGMDLLDALLKIELGFSTTRPTTPPTEVAVPALTAASAASSPN